MTDTRYKAHIRVPTAEQYAYLEIEVEDTAEAILEAYNRFTGLIKGGEGLQEREMNAFVDQMLRGESVLGGVELYERMNHMQKYTIQVIKRAMQRAKK